MEGIDGARSPDAAAATFFNTGRRNGYRCKEFIPSGRSRGRTAAGRRRTSGWALPGLPTRPQVLDQARHIRGVARVGGGPLRRQGADGVGEGGRLGSERVRAVRGGHDLNTAFLAPSPK